MTPTELIGEARAWLLHACGKNKPEVRVNIMIDKLTTALERSEAENRRLRRALEPFANAITDEGMFEMPRGEYLVCARSTCPIDLTVRHLEAARAALKGDDDGG